MTARGGTQSATVTLNVTAPTTSGLTLSSSALTFSAVAGGVVPASQIAHGDGPDQYQCYRPGVGADLQRQQLADPLTDR